MTTEKYANPGLYLDTDDHGRLIEENREAYLRDEAERKADKLRKIEQALDVVATQHARDELHEEKERLEARLAWLHDELEAHR